MMYSPHSRRSRTPRSRDAFRTIRSEAYFSGGQQGNLISGRFLSTDGLQLFDHDRKLVEHFRVADEADRDQLSPHLVGVDPAVRHGVDLLPLSLRHPPGVVRAVLAAKIEAAITKLNLWQGRWVTINESLSRIRNQVWSHDRHFATRSQFPLLLEQAGWCISGSTIDLSGRSDEQQSYYQLTLDRLVAVEGDGFDVAEGTLAEWSPTGPR